MTIIHKAFNLPNRKYYQQESRQLFFISSRDKIRRPNIMYVKSDMDYIRKNFLILEVIWD